MRMCLGCREMKQKKELIRIVKQADTIRLDPTGRAAGRGAYICRNAACLEHCIKNKALHKTFEMQVEAGVYESLKEELRNLDKTE